MSLPERQLFLIVLVLYSIKMFRQMHTLYRSESIVCVSGKEAVEVWYGEIKDYDWNSPGFGYKTGNLPNSPNWSQLALTLSRK